jgi:predicted alpha/beta-fold hydrolase
VPTLVVTALDDPLHSIDCIGFEERPLNGNVAFLVTATGGHVAWPQVSLYLCDGWVGKRVCELCVFVYRLSVCVCAETLLGLRDGCHRIGVI